MGIQLITKIQYQAMAGSIFRTGFRFISTASSAPRKVVKKDRLAAKKIW